MIKRVFIAAALIAMASPAAADFANGWDAYLKQDYATARQEWQPLAESGDAKAQYAIGIVYAKGQGVEQNFAEAVRWFTSAAEQGNPNARYLLGYMYRLGQGVERDPVKAYMWFDLAAGGGLASAAQARDLLADDMSADQIAAAQALIEADRGGD